MPELRFYYTKSPFHQEIKADGAIGGPNPTGDSLVMSIYTERAAIPRVVVQKIDDRGLVGEEIREKRVTKDGVVRVVQATLHMDVAQAKAMHEWLGGQIAQVERIEKEK